MNVNTEVFDTVAKSDVLGFGKQAYLQVEDFLSLDKKDIAKLAQISQSSVRYDSRMPTVLKERLNEIANLCQLVGEYFNGDREKTALWFKTTNPFLGSYSPRDLIRIGRYKKLMQFVIDSKRGQKKKDSQ